MEVRDTCLKSLKVTLKTGSDMPEEICNKTYIVFPTSPNSVLLLYLVTRV